MRILHLIPTLEGGGAEKQLSTLVNAQAVEGFFVSIAMARSGVNSKRIQSENIGLHLLGHSRAKGFFKALTLVRKLKPDIIQTWLPSMDLLGGVLSAFSRTPWVISERSNASAYSLNRPTILFRRILAKRASAIVANSNGGCQYWRSNGITGQKIYQIPNAIDFNEIFNALNGNSDQAPLEGAILAVGRLNQSKGIDQILRAISIVREKQQVQLIVIGDGPYRKDLEKLVVDLKLSSDVRFFSFEQNWWSRLKDASMLISMSRFEGQPNVVLETMACACPLIVSDIPAHREILDEASATLIALNDLEGLANAISMNLRNPLRAREKAEVAVQRTVAFSIESVVKKYRAVYDHCRYVNKR